MGGGGGGGLAFVIIGSPFRHYRVAFGILGFQNISRHSACAGDSFSHEASVAEGRV